MKTNTISGVNFTNSSQIDTRQKQKYVDPLANWPMRGLAYTNDIGISINEIAPTAARLFWVPALMYFGADIYDKYKNKGNKYDPNAGRAFSQAIFQAVASIILPTVAGHIGQSFFSAIDRLSPKRLSTNAKEQTLRFIKSHADEHEIFNFTDSKDAIKNFETKFQIFYNDKKAKYKKNNIFAKIYDNLLGNCKKSAIANSNEKRLTKYANNKFENLITNCKNTTELEKLIDKEIFKLKAWKSLGAFTAIILAVKPIDIFTEKMIKKYIRPHMEKFNDAIVKFSEFGKRKTTEQNDRPNPIQNSSKEEESAQIQKTGEQKQENEITEQHTAQS